jgi:peptidoglycan/xylan/chitin deacetylase (PgdA/CDA1 family)
VSTFNGKLELAQGQRLLILMYHHVAVPPANVRLRGLYTTPRQFDGHLRWLKKQPVEFTTFEQLRSGAHSSCSRLVMLTFDDGLHDNFTEALPVLRRHDVPAVVYPIVNELGGRGVVWPEAIDQTPVDLISENEIREMQRDGIEFGSHLLEHTHLTTHPVDEQNRQLVESRDALQKILAAEVLSVAYPYGDVDDGIAERAAKAGYCFGMTTVAGTNTRDSNPMLLNRVPAKGSKFYHPFKFRRKVRRLLNI